MKKSNLTTAIVFIAAMTAWGFGRGFLRAALLPAGAEAQMREIALQMNRSLPRTIDAMTELSFAAGSDHTIEFHYKVARPATEIDATAFADSIRTNFVQGTCTDEDLHDRFLAKNITVRHVFQDPSHRIITSIDVPPSACPK